MLIRIRNTINTYFYEDKNKKNDPEVSKPKVDLHDDAEDRCAFYLSRKKRKCKMMVRPGKRFCGEHALHEDGQPQGNLKLFRKNQV